MPKTRKTKITQVRNRKGTFVVWKRVKGGMFSGLWRTSGYMAKAKAKGTNDKIRLAFIGDDYDDTWQEIKFKKK